MRKWTFLVAVCLAFPLISFLGGNDALQAAEPYVIGYLTDVTGPARANYAPESEGFRLYMDTVNARGGINGHPVEVIIEDGKSDPSRSASVAKKMIVENNVLAICGLGFSASQPPVYALAKKEGVPVLAGYSCTENVTQCQPGTVVFATGYIFTPEFCPSAYVSARIVEALKPKGSTVAITGFATPGARVWTDLSQTWLKEMGYNVVYREDIPPQAVDLSPWINKVAELNPHSYVTIVGTSLLIPQLVGLEKMGYRNEIIFPDFVPESDLVNGIKRLVTRNEQLIWGGRYATVYENLPEMKKIEEAMKKFGHQYPFSARLCQGWTMGRVMEQALQRAGWPCSRTDLIAALEKTDLDTRGLTGGPMRFTPTNHYGPNWWRAYRWDYDKKALVPAVDWFEAKDRPVEKK